MNLVQRKNTNVTNKLRTTYTNQQVGSAGSPVTKFSVFQAKSGNETIKYAVNSPTPSSDCMPSIDKQQHWQGC